MTNASSRSKLQTKMARVRALRKRVKPSKPYVPSVRRAKTCTQPIQHLNSHYVVRILRDDRLNTASPQLARAAQLLKGVPRKVRKGCVKCQTHKQHAEEAVIRMAKRALVALPEHKLHDIKDSLGLRGDIKIEVYAPGTQRNPVRTRIVR